MLNEKDCCLLVVDVQGKLAGLMHDKDNLFKNIRILIQSAKILDIPILWCQQVPSALGPTVPEIAELLGGCEPINKSSFSCCGFEEFNSKLEELGRKQVLLCGIETHVCVYQTAVDLIERDYEVDVIADAVSSRTLDNKQIGLNRIAAEGARISSTELALFEILKSADHPQFKQIAKLVK
ncbi:MAG: hydrolase [Sedimentisphaerales bacterium]|nr:hydrolase [Sedimentisphaerales bacterium]